MNGEWCCWLLENCLGLSVLILLTPRDDLFSALRMESKPASMSASWKPKLYKARDVMATCEWQLCDWTSNGPHEGKTNHKSWAATVCKVYSCDTYRLERCTLLCWVALENAVYKPTYSARSCFHSCWNCWLGRMYWQASQWNVRVHHIHHTHTV